jgi:protein-tyrosine phosphatase
MLVAAGWQFKARRLISSVLKHPLVLRAKAPLRNVWWALKGRGTRNPPIPARVESMLFVCLGNICRSPFGAELAKRLLPEAGKGHIRCASAGIRPSQDRQSPRDACRASAGYGISLEEHVPQALTRELMASHDMVVVMEWRQLEELRAAYPEHHDRIFLLSLFDDAAENAYERLNIADPFGRPVVAFEECYRRIDRSLRRCLAAVQN